MGRPEQRGTITPGDGDPRHGTENAYSNYGCTCDPCKDAGTAAHARRRAAAHQANIPADAHGTESGYSYWGCREECCRSAHRERNRRRDRRRVTT